MGFLDDFKRQANEQPSERKVRNPQECEHPTSLVKRSQKKRSNGEIFVCDQCLICGASVKSSIPFDEVGGRKLVEQLPFFDQGLYERGLQIEQEQQRQKREAEKQVNKGIPTEYKGIQFRSRLEARWACFFDLCGWRWEYEPEELLGWIPDFVLIGAEETLVEVKPVRPKIVTGANGQGEFCKLPDEGADVFEKYFRADDSRDCLLVGLGPFERLGGGIWANTDEWPSLGWLCEGESKDVSLAIMSIWPGNSKIGFCHEICCYRDRITGEHDGNPWHGLSFETVDSLWSEAGNATQWNAPRRSRRWR